MGIINRLLRRFGRSQSDAMLTGEEAHGITSEIGMRPTPERQQRLEYSWETIDYDYRAVVLDIRRMDREDGWRAT